MTKWVTEWPSEGSGHRWGRGLAGGVGDFVPAGNVMMTKLT